MPDVANPVVVFTCTVPFVPGNISLQIYFFYINIKDSIENEKVSIVILDDRDLSKDKKVIPMALAIGFINQHLQLDGIRNTVSIIAVSGEVYDPHSAAVLLAFSIASKCSGSISTVLA